MVPLFKALVRPILECGNVVWCPKKKRHIELIESVQRNFSTVITREYRSRTETAHPEFSP